MQAVVVPADSKPSGFELSDLKDSFVQRQTMVDCQVRTFDVTDQRLIGRLLAVPRERFVPDDMRHLAYSDVAFTMTPSGQSGEGRYLLPPLILARLIQGARVRPSDRVLDVAGGGGYSTAILAGLAADVTALETLDRRDGLARRLRSFGLEHVQIAAGPLGAGVTEGGAFDVIVVNGAVEIGLETLLGQLTEGGRLVTIERSAVDPTGRAAKAICFEKHNGAIGRRYLFDAVAPVLPDFRRAAGFQF